MKTKGTVWVLGASSGLGLTTAKAFARNGWLVVVGARSFVGPQEGQRSLVGPDGIIHSLALDVTEETSCRDFVQKALQISPQVDVLCYAAGLLMLGSCEETSPEEYARVMQVNFIGMTRMVGMALPMMRAQGGGKLVLFSSLNGLIGVPFQSAYTASKHAIEGYAQCLSMETKPHGIQVCVVEPGDHQGGSQSYRLHSENAAEISPYTRECRSAVATIHRDEAKGLSPDALGQKVARNASRRKMRFRLRIARLDQRAAVRLHGLLWPGAFFSILRAYYVQKG